VSDADSRAATGGPPPRWASDPVVATAARERAPDASRVPAIVLGEGRPVPPLLGGSANPNSGGLYPLGRRYTIGDEATLELSQLRGPANPHRYTLRVTRVDEANDRVELNDGETVWDLMGNGVKVAGAVFDPPRQFVPAELYVGRRWRAAFRGTQLVEDMRFKAGSERSVTVDIAIVARERIATPAGEFDAFRAQGYGTSGIHTLEERIWYVPYLNFPVRWDRWSHYYRGGHPTYGWANRRELVSARQFAVGA